jgi:glycosyltransferase involved in cell wall biosynthesis
MKLFFDARYIRTDVYDGISRYSAELGAAVAKQHEDTTFLICKEAQKAYLPKGVKTLMLHDVESPIEAFTSLKLNKYAPDVVFSPMQTMGSFGRNFKLILTLHDMIYYRHRTPPVQLQPYVKLGWRLFHLAYWPQRLVLNAADMVATVSETSRRDIENARLTKQPLIVVSNAPRDLSEFFKKPKNTQKNAPKNLIYMGWFREYKNVKLLVRGLTFLPDHTLHLLSRITKEQKVDLLKGIEESVKKRIIFHNGVSDKKYAELLADNALLVTASLDEGYGLSVAEAFSLSVPAVVSNLPIFHEVAGDGALYFDPKNAHDFAEKVKEASKVTTYNKLAKEGHRHIAQFTWEASATRLIKSAKSLCQK